MCGIFGIVGNSSDNKADIKKLSLSLIHSKLDHSFMVWEKDSEMIDFFKSSR